MDTQEMQTTPRKPFEVPQLAGFFQAVTWTEKALADGVPAEEIEKACLKLYTPVARTEATTRRHQMTMVAVIVAMQSLKLVEELRAKLLGSDAAAVPVTDQLVPTELAQKVEALEKQLKALKAKASKAGPKAAKKNPLRGAPSKRKHPKPTYT